jgi:hypothetical protein
VLVDEDDPEKRIADLERQVAAPRTAREARADRKRARVQRKRRLREARKRVEDEAGVSAAPVGRTSIVVVFRSLLAVGLLGMAVYTVGLVLPHPPSWMGIGGLALFFGGFVSMFAWIIAGALKNSLKDLRNIEKVRWQEGTVTFRTVEPGKVDDEIGKQRVFCEVELNPTTRITRVRTSVEPLDIRRLVIGATMRCLIDRLDIDIALRAFPDAQPDAPLPSGRELQFYEEKAKG